MIYDDDDDYPVQSSGSAPQRLYHEAMGFEDKRLETFEEFAAGTLIAALKLPAGIKKQIYEAASTVGRSRPWLEDVRETVVNLPIYPVADRQPNLRDNAGLSAFFPAKNFHKLPLLKRFIEIRQDTEFDRAGRPLVWIIKWPRVEAGVCVHTIPADEDIFGVRFSCRVQPPDMKPFTLTIEPMAQLRNLLVAWGWQL